MDRYRPKSNVIFDDINLSHYNAFAFGCNLFDRPERDVDIISVPGRQGDLVLDNGRYKNIIREYQVQVTGIKNIETLIQELTKKVGYFRLEDDYDSEVYFEARLAEPPTIKRFVGEAASVTVRFDRKPQRYLKSGENVAITESTFIGTWQFPSSQYEDRNIVGTFKMVINNPYNGNMTPRIYIPGGQPGSPTYTWRVWLNVLDVNLDAPDSELLNGDMRKTIERSEGGHTYYEYEDNKTVYFLVNAPFFFNNTWVEVDSEKRAFKYGSGYDPSSTGYAQFTNYRDFPIIKPGENYFYFTFGTRSGWDGTLPWSNIKKPMVYPRWWSV